MERNTVTTLGALRTGDRFYIKADKQKTVWEVIGQQPPLVVVNQPLAVNGTYRYLHHLTRKPSYVVVFLRHTAESDIAQQPLKLPNE